MARNWCHGDGRRQAWQKAVAVTNQVRTSLAASTEQDLSELIQLNTLEAEEPSNDRPLYDPLSMYPADAPERRDDRIRPLEAAVPGAGAMADPLRLYDDASGDDAAAEPSTSTMSRALPFLTRPLHLDGALAGDAGFDPLGLVAASPDRLVFMLEAEIKHARLAMLAAAGWVGSELAGGRLSSTSSASPPPPPTASSSCGRRRSSTPGWPCSPPRGGSGPS